LTIAVRNPPATVMKSSISIIVCCYNSEQRLPETLRCLATLETGDLQVELILVDNRSTDSTKEIARQLWAQYGSAIPLIVADQPVPGLAAARRKGIAASQSEYLLFCDDDNWLDRGYLAYAVEVMEVHPEVGILGGLNEPACEVEPPGWFAKAGRAYAVGPQEPSTGEAWLIWGAGMVLRKSALVALQEVGFQNLLSDRKGGNLSSGGDYELCWALRMAGIKLWYDERLRLQHFIPKERLTEVYLRRLFRSTAYCVLGLQPYQSILERDIRRENEITRTIFWRKAARLFVELSGETVQLKPLFAVLKSDLLALLSFRRRLLMLWICLLHTGELVRNTKSVLVLRRRLNARHTTEAAPNEGEGLQCHAART